MDLFPALTMAAVPSGVLSVLPGYGESTGVEIAKHPFVRKIDVTVRIFDLNH